MTIHPIDSSYTSKVKIVVIGPPYAEIVAAGSFAVGTTYTIVFVGTTNFMLIGAASNTVGVVFVATGAGAGTGTASGVLRKSVAFPQIISAKLSKDLINEMSSTFEFQIDDAAEYYNQFNKYNPIQHGSRVEVYLGDDSGGIATFPVASTGGWFKKFTGYIYKVGAGIEGGVRNLSATAADKMWVVLNARARIHDGTPSIPFSGHLAPIDTDYLIWEVIEHGTGSPLIPVIDLDETSQPIIYRYFIDPDPLPTPPVRPEYDLPKIRGPKKLIVPGEYEVNYALGRVIFKSPQDPGLISNSVYGFDINCFIYDDTNYEPYYLEDVLYQFLTAPVRQGGANLAPGVDFNFYDADGTARYIIFGGAYILNVAYTGTRIKVSNVDWDEDSGMGRDFIDMLREAGVMPYNYFLYCDVNGLIRGEYILQSTSLDTTISREIVATFPSSIDETYTKAIVISNGNTYPNALITAANGSWGPTEFHTVNSDQNMEIVNETHEDVDDPRRTTWSDTGTGDYPYSHIKAWESMGAATGFDLLADASVMTYRGIITCGKFQFTPPEALDFGGMSEDEFYYPFPNVRRPVLPGLPQVSSGGQEDVIFCDWIFDNPTEVAKIVLQMFIPTSKNVTGAPNTFHPTLYRSGDSRKPFDAYDLILSKPGGIARFAGVNQVNMTAMLSVLYGTQEDFDAAVAPMRNFGAQSSAFTMDPTETDTKIFDVEKGQLVKTVRVIFHRPFVALIGNIGPFRRAAIYMLNTFQLYDRGTIVLPAKDVNHQSILPFAAVTNDTDLAANPSHLNETGLVQGIPATTTIVADPSVNVADYQGCLICVPTPGGDPYNPYIAEVVYNDKSLEPASQTIVSRVIAGRTHTDVFGGGAPASYVQVGDRWYLMHKRYWLDLLYDRIDLLKTHLMRKFNNIGLTNKVMVIEQPDITDLGTAIRKAVHELHSAISNFSGIECSVMYRSEYDVGYTVQDLVLKTPRYLITTCEYIFSGGGEISVNLKLVNFDKDVV